MSSKRAFTVVAVLLALLGAGAASAEEALEGAWAGGISFGGWYPIRVEFGAAEARVYPGRSAEAQPLKSVERKGEEVRFEWDEEDGLIRFVGTVTDESIIGTIEQAGRSGTFSLERVVSVDTKFFDALKGLYELSPREYIWIGRVSELRQQPSFIHLGTGRLGTLYAKSKTEFIAGAGMHAPEPRGVRITFSDGRLRFQEGESAPRVAGRLDAYREEAVEFRNGNVTLAGTVITPALGRKHPAVVFLHGSGGSTRAYFSALPYLLAANGVASLVYDKRGTGGSTGHRFQSTFYDLADDALAGVRMLQGRGDIDANQIGVWGHSQGGWTAPLAAVRSADVRFVVTAAGAVVSVDQQIRDQMRRSMKAAGHTDEEVAAARRHLDLYFDVRDSVAAWSDLSASTEEAKKSKWSRFAWIPESEATVRGKRAEIYDPDVTLRQLRVPLLALYGAKDDVVHPDDNLARLEAYLRASGNQQARIQVFPDANHDFLLVGGNRYVANYFDTIVKWILERVETSRPIAITNVGVIRKRGDRALREQDVIIDEGRIAAMGNVPIPPHAKRIDGTGKYLMPGLAVTRGTLSPIELTRYLASGVTTILNVDEKTQYVHWRERIERGSLTGPRLVPLAGCPSEDRCRDDFEAIGVGKRADLLLLDGDPPIEVSNLRGIAGVMADGRWYSSDELRERIDALPRAIEDEKRLLASVENNTDRVVAYLRENDPFGTLAVDMLAEVAVGESVADLSKIVERLRAANVIGESTLNAVGERLRERFPEKASEVFSLSTRFHPACAPTE